MASEDPRPPTDYRRLRRQQDRAILWLVVGTVLLVFGALIYAVYGRWALMTGLMCLLPGAGIILVLWGLLTLIERWVQD